MCSKVFNLAVLVLYSSFTFAQGYDQITLSGYVYENESKELLPGVNVYTSGAATQSNSYGFYSLQIPASTEIVITISFVGFKSISIPVNSSENLTKDFYLQNGNLLDEVVVSAQELQESVSDQVQMSKVSVPIQQIKQIPALLGEKDVLKVLQLMPGVQNGSEGQSGLYVRGGGPDQNLLILDEAPVYNANHLFGFFSVFNGDAIKSVELTKGGFPAQYGGRLSSVVNMRMKEGNKEKLHGEGGIGLISSRLTLEGPIKKGKTSFLVSGRRTYIDVLAQPFIRRIAEQEGTISNVGYYFYDLNTKLNHDFGRKDKLYVSGYFGRDVFYANIEEDDNRSESGLNWGNATATVRWNHLFNPKLFANTSLIFSSFQFGINALEAQRPDENSDFEPNYSLRYDSRITDVGIKADFDYYPNNKHSVKFGTNIIRHQFEPSALAVTGTFTEEELSFKEREILALESGTYIEDTWQPTSKIKMNVGLRLSHFGAEGSQYWNLEPRAAIAYKIKPTASIKASYAQMNQYIHLLSNTGIGLPTDLWVTTTDVVQPQFSEQVAVGLAKDFKQKGLFFSLEAYYKNMDHIVSYKEGASFFNFDGTGSQVSFEDQVTQGAGWSYGLEFLLQKKIGKLTGWVGYTWSKTEWQFDDLNFGETFFPRYDRRHDISIVGNYELNKRISFSATWVYGTGNALTLPLANYQIKMDERPRENNFQGRFADYGPRNSFRAEPFHRLDVALRFKKKKKRHERTWEFGAYNVYDRRNPFFYDIRQSTNTNSQNIESTTVLNRVSLFPIIPSISYSFKF